MKWSLKTFVRDTTAMLSWYVQKMLRSDDQETIYSTMKFPSQLNCDWKIVGDI